LLQFFPPELVYIILDAAQYWVHTKTMREQHVEGQAALSPTHNMSMCYLVTPPILDACTHQGETVPLRIASVQFTTVSYDQGWCSDGGLRGQYRTYPGYSWFEAAILRPSQAPDSRPWVNLADTPVELDSTTRYDPKLEVEGGDKCRWPLQRNFCASSESRAHVITWNSGAVASESITGAGHGEGFVERLRSGDQIGVIARARFPGWSNVVERVEVSLSYSLV
ncbi:hypothetical protein DFH06DRAFT_1016401, partial [Mycena polygramma]